MKADYLPGHFAQQRRAALIAPAGCGKTELIARAVGCCKSRQLVLTHTHAGVDSLRARFRKLGTPSSRYHVATLHSFALRYASAYPKTSAIATVEPKERQDYVDVMEAGKTFIETKLARNILKDSYGGVFVDEYQDCSVLQHQFVLGIAEALPCRIVGDPLQGIFDFGSNGIVDWETHVATCFTRMPELTEPWRWHTSNPALGAWLTTEVRKRLQAGQPVRLDRDILPADCAWQKHSDRGTLSTLKASLGHDGTTFVLCDPAVPGKAHSIASKLKNRFKSIEPVTSKEICGHAEAIESATGEKRLEAAVEFARACLTWSSVRPDYMAVLGALDGTNSVKSAKRRKLLMLAQRVVSDSSLRPVLELFEYFQSDYRPTVKRYQLWGEMKSALREVASDGAGTLEEAAWSTRNRSGHLGRRIPKRCISRTLLLKGLECDHSIVLGADCLDTRNLYVALTRGSRRLTILSHAPVLIPVDARPSCPRCNSKMIPRSSNASLFLGCSKFPSCKGTRSVPSSAGQT